LLGVFFFFVLFCGAGEGGRRMESNEMGRELLNELGVLQLYGLDAYRAPSDRSLVEASLSRNKDGLLEAHIRFMRRFQELERDWQLMKLQDAGFASSNGHESSGVVAAEAAKMSRKKQHQQQGLLPKGMTSIRLVELKVGKQHHGRVLYGVLCAEAFFLSLIQTLVEDEDGNAARVMIDDSSLDGSASWAKVQMRYRKGMKIAIRNPFLSDLPDESVALRVHSEDDVVILSEGPPLLPSEVNPPWTKLDAADLRTEGNRLFAKHDWAGAIDFYSKCIRKSLLSVSPAKQPQPPAPRGKKKKKPGSSNHAIPNKATVKSVALVDQDTVMLAYSNRAAAWMKLQHYEKALVDAEEALKLDPSHLKSIYRKGRALHALERYEQACKSFSEALGLVSQDKDVKGALQKSEICLQQIQQGVYDLSKHLLSGCEGSLPECSDYVGPVEIKISTTTGRRGLFVTRDVGVGELLLVSNALAIVRSDTTSLENFEACPSRSNASFRDDLLVKIYCLVLKSPKWLQHLSCLSDSECPGNEKLPPMDLFRSGGKWGETKLHSAQDMSVRRVMGLLLQNAIDESGCCTQPALTKSSTKEQQGQFLGLWALPSFVNHSCTPTSARLHLGDALLLHASRQLEAGEEVTFTYVNSMLPLQIRQEFLEQDSWKFQCTCARCELETRLKESLEHIGKHFQSLWAVNETFIPGTSETLDMANIAIKVEHLLKANGSYAYEQQLIRASFFIAYWFGYLNLERMGKHALKLPPPEMVIDATTAAAPGDGNALVFAAFWLKKFEDQGASKLVVNDVQNRAMLIFKCLYGKQKSSVLKKLMRAQAAN